METTAYHFHCSNELGALLQLRAGDDAGQVTWLNINPTTEHRYGPPALPLRRCCNSRFAMYNELCTSALSLQKRRLCSSSALPHP